MAECEACEKLVGAKSDVEPHGALVQIGGHTYKTVGFRTGTVLEYDCQAWGTKWQRDIDDQDKFACWEERPS